MRWGSGWNRFYRERQPIRDGRRIIGCFLKRCCGVSARDRRHEPMRAGSSRVLWEREPCRPALSSVPLSSGCRRGFLSVVSACYPTHSIYQSYRWTERSCKPTQRLRDPKKGLIRRHQTFKRRSDEQDRRADGRNWEVSPLDHPPRPESRSGGDARPSSRH